MIHKFQSDRESNANDCGIFLSQPSFDRNRIVFWKQLKKQVRNFKELVPKQEGCV
ncbi:MULTISPECIES: hypothetical protein [Leptospira]|uniref:hypothetical protein n=1 Tax=Leptospira TaxID=171 RepID=UPI00031E811F|nr:MULTISPECIES: hypothetical protein [Leptospira]MBW9233118.1 hypothetical protein [Leptospira santarosai]MDI7184385.1 hypothetical protein [Leptospira santarosai]MDO6402448.1 hypothetical protein [Leptospira santarosai]